MFAPVEVAGINDYTSDGGAVAADPFCGRVDNDICSVFDGADEVTTGSKGVVDLLNVSSHI